MEYLDKVKNEAERVASLEAALLEMDSEVDAGLLELVTADPELLIHHCQKRKWPQVG